jgi:hypothetical protein
VPLCRYNEHLKGVDRTLQQNGTPFARLSFNQQDNGADFAVICATCDLNCRLFQNDDNHNIDVVKIMITITSTWHFDGGGGIGIKPQPGILSSVVSMRYEACTHILR